MTDFPDLKIKALVNFPATVLDGTGIDVTRQNGTYRFDLAYDDFVPPVTGVLDPAHQNALLWNSITNSYVLAPITLIGSAGSVPEAPNDGVQYGRQSLAWTAVSGGTPSSSNPLMDGVAAPGASSTYARGDHVHPTDSSRAPLASPVFTGDPRAPTPTAGDNDTSIATTAFVTSAIGAGGTFVDAPIDGSSYGRLNAVWAKVAPLNSPVMTGTPVAPTAVPATNTTQIATTAFVNAAVTASSNVNVLINSDFRINQGGYVSTAVLAAGSYGHDQWKAGASGGDYSFTQLGISTQITIAAGKSLIQPIELVRVVGGSYVLTWTGTAQARAGVNTLTPSGSYSVSPLFIPGQAAGTVMSVEFNSGTLGTVKLESGTIATPFVMSNYATELALCQRYWHSYVEIFTDVTVAVPGAKVSHLHYFPTMRTVPTVLQTTFANIANTSGITNNATFLYDNAIEIYLVPTATNVLCSGVATFTFSARL